jgi:hypothetical protein
MADRYDIVSPRKDRNGKTRWTKVGVAFPAKQGDGFNLIFEAYPLPDENGEVRANLFPPRDNQQQSGGQQRQPDPARQRPQDGDALDDEIPW